MTERINDNRFTGATPGITRGETRQPVIDDLDLGYTEERNKVKPEIIQDLATSFRTLRGKDPRNRSQRIR